MISAVHLQDLLVSANSLIKKSRRTKIKKVEEQRESCLMYVPYVVGFWETCFPLFLVGGGGGVLYLILLFTFLNYIYFFTVVLILNCWSCWNKKFLL